MGRNERITMATTPAPKQAGSPRASLSGRVLLLAALAAFIAGGALVGWVVWYNMQPGRIAGAPNAAVADPGAAAPAGAVPKPALTAKPTPMAATEQAVERVAEQQGGLDQRLAAAEQRLTQLDLQAQAAAGNAARAESLLIAFATRRAVERGAELGYLSDQLRLRFGDQWPNAVATIIDFSRQPIRLDALVARLEGLGPQ